MKQILHTGHLRIKRTKSNTRLTMNRSNIPKDIDEMMSNCNACQKYRNLNPRKLLSSHEIPKHVLSCISLLHITPASTWN